MALIENQIRSRKKHTHTNGNKKKIAAVEYIDEEKETNEEKYKTMK